MGLVELVDRQEGPRPEELVSICRSSEYVAEDQFPGLQLRRRFLRTLDFHANHPPRILLVLVFPQ